MIWKDFTILETPESVFPISLLWLPLTCTKQASYWSNLKVGIFGHLTIQLTCATDAESLGNQTVNQNVWPHSSYHDSELKSQWKSIKILLKLSDGYRKPTDVEMSDKKHVEKKNQTENCIMWLHLYSKLLLFK
jgi:hypothetical protein